MKTIVAFLALVASCSAADYSTILAIAEAQAEAEAVAIVTPSVKTPPQVETPPPAPKRPAVADTADGQSTPWAGVGAMLNALKPRPDEVLLDPGCGHDARLLIAAVQYFGTEKAIGIEIDADAADAARDAVEAAGLSDRIEIITGDSTQLDLEADIALAYLWPETLAELRPQLEKLDRFACYGFPVPGLPMQAKRVSNGGTVYTWTKPAPPPAVTRVPITRSVRQTVQLPRGSWCSVCGRHCGNPMAHRQYHQVVGYREVATPQAAPPASPPPRPAQVSSPSYSISSAPRLQQSGNCANCQNCNRGGFFRRR
jgi:hypothetical protein